MIGAMTDVMIVGMAVTMTAIMIDVDAAVTVQQAPLLVVSSVALLATT
jgi:hypothetical protein